jgi:hypothetical protein
MVVPFERVGLVWIEFVVAQIRAAQGIESRSGLADTESRSYRGQRRQEFRGHRNLPRGHDKAARRASLRSRIVARLTEDPFNATKVHLRSAFFGLSVASRSGRESAETWSFYRVAASDLSLACWIRSTATAVC